MGHDRQICQPVKLPIRGDIYWKLRAFEINDEERLSVLKNWLCWEVICLLKLSYGRKKTNVKPQRDCSQFQAIDSSHVITV